MGYTRFKALALLAVLALVGAACSKNNASSSGPSASASPSATAGCPQTVTVKTAAPGSVVKIGFIGDLTGSNSSLVVPGRNAAELAFDQANASGALKVKIVFVPLDNKEANPATAPTLAHQLIGDKAVVGVIGPAFSGETSAVQPLFAAAGLTHITQSATRADLTAHGCKTFFRSVGGDTDQAKAAGDMAVKAKSCKAVAVVDDKSAYGAGYGDIAAQTVKDDGGSLVARESVAPTTDYTSLVDTISSKGADCVIYGGYEPQASILVKQIHTKGIKVLFISGDGSKSVKFVPHAGKAAAEGTIFTCPCLDANVSSAPAAKRFVAQYKAKFGVAPDIYAPEAYDVAQIFIYAIKACGSAVTRACVLMQVTNLKNFVGLTKTFNWTTDPASLHEVTDKGVNIYTVKGGVIKLLGNVNTIVK
ncbi:MAG: branched-chain amino acid ABC transporter substrate-binding protein [Actinomycetota bacterium]